MQLYSIASGSSGNCIYVGGEEARILIDAGISMKRIREGLMEENFPIENLHAIFITHEHTDHICGLGPYCASTRFLFMLRRKRLRQYGKKVI